MLTEEQKTLIRAALDGKQMQWYCITPTPPNQWHDVDQLGAIRLILSKKGVRIAPQPRVLHCVQDTAGSLYVRKGETCARSYARDSDERYKYARIEIQPDGTITGKVEL